MKIFLVLLGFALQAALWLPAPADAQLPVRQREPAEVQFGSAGPVAPIADLSSSSFAARLSFSRVVSTLQSWRGAPDARTSSPILDAEAVATRLVVAEAFSRRTLDCELACTESVATFATWLPPPVLQIRSK